MRRKSPPSALPDGEEVPSWVLDAQSYRAAAAELGIADVDPRDVLGRDTGVKVDRMARLHEAQEERRLRAQQWCAERGLSYCMTVLGWRKPSKDEAAAGLTVGAGPKYAEHVKRRELYR